METNRFRDVHHHKLIQTDKRQIKPLTEKVSRVSRDQPTKKTKSFLSDSVSSP